MSLTTKPLLNGAKEREMKKGILVCFMVLVGFLGGCSEDVSELPSSFGREVEIKEAVKAWSGCIMHPQGVDCEVLKEIQADFQKTNNLLGVVTQQRVFHTLIEKGYLPEAYAFQKERSLFVGPGEKEEMVLLFWDKAKKSEDFRLLASNLKLAEGIIPLPKIREVARVRIRALVATPVWSPDDFQEFSTWQHYVADEVSMVAPAIRNARELMLFGKVPEAREVFKQMGVDLTPEIKKQVVDGLDIPARLKEAL